MKCSESAAWKRLQRGRKAFKKLLDRDPEFKSALERQNNE
jgi:DNA-directed RNA polymerase specialized sigma24 family protein